MHDIGGIVWIIIVVIAVISSMRRNVQRARAARSAQVQPAQPAQQPRTMQQPQTMQQPAPPRPAAPAVRQAPPPLTLSGFAMPPVDAPSVVPAPAPAPRPMPAPTPTRVGTSPIRGMFGGGPTLVRAIVAAEVLGPPIALQERTIWSPRHSEPSI